MELLQSCTRPSISGWPSHTLPENSIIYIAAAAFMPWCGWHGVTLCYVFKIMFDSVRCINMYPKGSDIIFMNTHTVYHTSDRSTREFLVLCFCLITLYLVHLCISLTLIRQYWFAGNWAILLPLFQRSKIAMDWIGLDLFNDDTCPSGHISRPTHVTNALEHWQLAMLPQSERCEIDPRIGHDNLSVSLWAVRVSLSQNIKSMGQRKKDVTPVLTHWSYVFLALSHRNINTKNVPSFFFQAPTEFVNIYRHVRNDDRRMHSGEAVEDS